MKLNRAVAVNVGKQARSLTRTLGRGGGTSLPGLLAERIDPGIVAGLGAELPNGCVFITGTNGKTTTTRILADAMRRSGWSVITNREGSNLLRGIGTVLLEHADRRGRLQVDEKTIGVFEVDEGALPGAIKTLKPSLVLVTNLFRDQLDRYFEMEFIVHLWVKAMAGMSKDATLVLNADDPQVAYLAEEVGAHAVYYGLEDSLHGYTGLEHAADSRRCLRCKADLEYQQNFYAHLGHYSCPKCGWVRPQADVRATRVRLDSLDGCELEVATPQGTQTLRTPLAGLFNAYNVLAAAAAASTLGVAPAALDAAVAGMEGAFGRLEQFDVGDKHVCLMLVKNPSGFNESLRLLLLDPEPKRLMLALNDFGPDGRDVSWIWDIDLERCLGRTTSIMVAGRRARDLALRLKYTGFSVPPAPAHDGPDQVEVMEDVAGAFWQAVDRTPPGETLYVLPTYTAMWTLRDDLVRKGYVARFWQHGGKPAATAGVGSGAA